MTHTDLHALKARLGLTTAALAHALNRSPRTVEQYLDGTRRISHALALQLATLTGQPTTCPTCGQRVTQGDRP